MIIFTHRGIEPSKKNFYPESSYEAFSNHLNRGFGIEFDPNFVKDGIVVNHDDSLNRITNGKDKRNFEEITLQEAAKITYKLQNEESVIGRIPTLREVLEIIEKSSVQLCALHLKGKFQEQKYLEKLVSILQEFPHVINRILIFDVKPETAEYLHGALGKFVAQSFVHLAPSVAHPYDIQRYKSVAGTLITVEDAILYKKEKLYDWVWLDEWDRSNENGDKTLYNKEVFTQLKAVEYKIALVTPELHATSPGLLGGEVHQDAITKEKLFLRIKQIIALNPDGICTDFPEEIRKLISI